MKSTTKKNRKSATIRELSNCDDLLRWIQAGEEVSIRNHGKIIARLVPEKPKQVAKRSVNKKVDWTKSAAFLQDKSDWPTLSAKEVALILGRDPKRFIGS